MSRLDLSSTARVEAFENNLVRVTLAGGEVTEGLEPRRLFPISRLEEYITLLDCDGREFAVVRRLSDLDAESRAVIEESLENYYLVPKIKRIITKSDKYGVLRWTVETDRGIITFDIRNRNHDIQLLSSGLVRVRDANDNRYVIEDYTKLDKRSYSLLIADT